MDWLDYRERLGVGFNDTQKTIKIYMFYNKTGLDTYFIDLEETEDATEVLMRIAKSRNCLSKGNELDYSKAAVLLIDDFRSGKIGRLSLEMPPEL